jgi:hypothetical protein
MRLNSRVGFLPPAQGAQGCCSAIWRALALDPAESGCAGIDGDQPMVAVKPVITMPARTIAEAATELPWGW